MPDHDSHSVDENAAQDAERTLETRLQNLEVSLAERRPVADLLKLFLYFLFALSIILGLFGWRQFSDVERMVADQVEVKLPRDSQRFADYESLIADTRQLYREYSTLVDSYEEALANYAHLDKVAGDFDIEGRCAKIFLESEERSNTEPTAGEYVGTLHEESWRTAAISTLRILASAQKRRQFDPDFIFNAAQASSRLGQHELALQLMQAALEKNPEDAATRAGALSDLASVAPKEERENAFEQLMGMVESLDGNSPNIVIGEAWNAAEASRRYTDLLRAIDVCERAPNTIKPSFLFVVKARTLLRRSRPGCIREARDALVLARRAFADESTQSQWFESTLAAFAEVEQVLRATEASKILIQQMGSH